MLNLKPKQFWCFRRPHGVSMSKSTVKSSPRPMENPKTLYIYIYIEYRDIDVDIEISLSYIFVNLKKEVTQHETMFI